MKTPRGFVPRRLDEPERVLVGMAGFEPTTTCTPSRCATRLRYIPTCRISLDF